VRGDQPFVGRDHFLPPPQRIGRDGSRWLFAADCLDHHISVVGKKTIEAVREKAGFERNVALSIHISNQHARQIEANAEARRNRRSRLVEEPDEAATNDTASGKSESHSVRRFNVGASHWNPG
jgi:hypothetical protein